MDGKWRQRLALMTHGHDGMNVQPKESIYLSIISHFVMWKSHLLNDISACNRFEKFVDDTILSEPPYHILWCIQEAVRHQQNVECCNNTIAIWISLYYLSTPWCHLCHATHITRYSSIPWWKLKSPAKIQRSMIPTLLTCTSALMQVRCHF